MKKLRPSSLPAFRMFRIAALLGLAAASAPLPLVRAATYTWTGNNTSTGDADWSSYSNWLNQVRPVGGNTTDLVFGALGSPNATGVSVQDLASTFVLRSFTFTAAAPTYVLSGADLSLGGNGTPGSITVSTVNAITLNNVVTCTNVPSITLDAGAGPLSLNGGLNTNNYAMFVSAGTTTGTGNTLNGNISGFSLYKEGAGILNLTGTNTFTGSVTLDAGTLSLGSAGAVGNAGIVFNGGTLRFTSANTTDYSGRLSTINGQFYSVDTNGQNVMFASALAGTGALSKLGAGTLTLTATNTFTGGTFVNAGTLVERGTGTGLGSNRSATISTGATLEINNPAVNGVIYQAGIILLGTGTLQKTGVGNVQLGGNGGNVVLKLGAGALIDVQAGTLSGSNSGQGIYTQNQAGLNIASGATFDGVEADVRVDALTGAGTLKGGYGAVGSTTIGVAGGAGTFIGVIADSGDVGGTLRLTKIGTGLQILAGNNTYSGGTTISAGTLQVGNGGTAGTLGSGSVVDNATLGFNRSDNLTVSNPITGTGNLAHIGGSTLTLTGANSYAGNTVIGGGNGTSTLQVGNGGTTGSLGGGEIIDNGVLAFNRSDNLTFANVISGTGGLTKLAGNTLTLTGTNTYTGATTVSAGTLAVGSADALGNGGQVSVNGGVLLTTASLTLMHSVGVPSGGAGTIAAAPGTTLTIGTNNDNTYFNAGGDVTFGAPGQTGTVVLQGSGISVSLGFALTISAGTLRPGVYAGNFANNFVEFLTGYAGSTTVAAGATLDFAGGTSNPPNGSAIGNLQGAGFVTGGPQSSTILTIASGSFSGTIYGGAGLAKNGGGTLVLSGVNTYTGATTINGGTLQLGNTNAIAASMLTTSSTGGTLAFTGGLGSATLSGLAGDGNVTLTDLGGSAVALTVGGNNATTTYSGVLGGKGSLTKTGTGTLNLGGINTYAGGTTIQAGTLSVASDAGLGAASGAVTFTGGGKLVITGAAFSTGRTFNLGFNSLAPAAAGTITYAGATVNGGFLGTGGTHVFADGASLHGTTAAVNSVLSQSAGTVAFNDTTVRGSYTQTGGALNAVDTVFTSAGSLTAGGTVNTSGVEIDGVTAINNGGLVNNTGSSLVFGGGSRTTINPGGTLTAASGTSIEVNGALLVNNGSQNGDLHVNYGSSARGTGFFGNVTVGQGGQFGNNGVAGGGNTNAANPAPAAANFWQALDRAQQIAAANPLPFLGPQLSTIPQQTNVQNLILSGGSTFNFNLQNTQGPAGVGYDLTNVGNQLTLTGSATTGNQISIRLIGLDGNGNNGTVAGFDPSQGYTFTLVHTANGIVGYTPGEFTVNTAGFSNGTQGGSFSVGQNGNDLVLIFAPVPEPGSWALLAIGVGSLLLVVRRRQRGG